MGLKCKDKAKLKKKDYKGCIYLILTFEKIIDAVYGAFIFTLVSSKFWYALGAS